MSDSETSESKRKFFSGRSVEQAVVSAASHYGITAGELKYRELEKRHGFVRTRRNVVISVDPADFRKAPGEAPAPRSAAAGAPRRREAPPARREPAPGEGEVPPVEAELEAEPEAEDEPEPVREAPSEGGGREAPADAAESEPGRESRRPRRPRRERAPRERRERPAEGARGRNEPARTPWWQAQPVGETAAGEEETEDLAGPEEEEREDLAGPDEGEREAFDEPAEEHTEEPGDEQPTELQPRAPFRGGPDRGEREGRYRFVERSEGLRRREGALPPAESGRPAGAGGRRDEERPQGRRSRGGRGGRGGRGDGGGRGGRGGGRPERREAAPPREPALPPAPRPAPRSERLPRAEGELAEAAQEALALLLGFADVEAEADFFLNEDRLEVELWGPDDHLLLQDDGALLLAIEHLLPRMLRGIYGDSMAARVDCNDFHFEREERLRELAVRTADDVRRRGRPRTLDELDPAERRIVHMALADDPDVTTDSIGEGYWKRLKVLPREEGG